MAKVQTQTIMTTQLVFRNRIPKNLIKADYFVMLYPTGDQTE
jgi:hypothetical protein